MTSTNPHPLQREYTEEEIKEIAQATYHAGELLAELLEAIDVLNTERFRAPLEEDLEDMIGVIRIIAHQGVRIRQDAVAHSLVQTAASDCTNDGLTVGDTLLRANYALTPEIGFSLKRAAPAEAS